jgi:apolipoprotein D and lipocalin family protein
MYRLTLILALALSACVGRTAGVPTGNFRAEGGPIYSSAVLDRTRLVGRWQQVATFGSATCKAGGVEIKPNGNAAFRLCLGGKDIKGAGPMEAIGPGRFAITGQEWWVLWADGDYRTLVIGTPEGNFGFVLNRGGAISSDRLTAAREILDWNGYDLSQFQPL